MLLGYIARMIGLMWASISIVAWLSGSTALQARAHNRPFDPGLALAILAMTMITFHLYASFTIASTPYSIKSLLIPIVDLMLLEAAAWTIRKRIRAGNRCLTSGALVLAGSLSFWIWYVSYLGGLVPR